MLAALIKSLVIFFQPRIIKILLFGILVSGLCFLAIWFIAWLFFLNNTFFEYSWVERLTEVLGSVAILMISWFLFPTVLSASLSLFLHNVACCVEEIFYSSLPKVPEPSIFLTLIPFLRFLFTLILLNFLLLGVFLFFAPAFIFVFLAVNGYLISREYFELVALRRLKVSDVKKLRKEHFLKLMLLGISVTVALMVPIVNLIMPIITTSIMVHMVESWKKQIKN